MSVTFRAKPDITTSNPTEFTITGEGLSNSDASVTFDDITIPIVKNVTVDVYKRQALYTRFSKEFSRPINEITNQFNVIQAGIAGAERCFEIIDEKEEFPENIGKPEIGKVNGHVEFKDVYKRQDLILK